MEPIFKVYGYVEPIPITRELRIASRWLDGKHIEPHFLFSKKRIAIFGGYEYPEWDGIIDENIKGDYIEIRFDKCKATTIKISFEDIKEIIEDCLKELKKYKIIKKYKEI